MMDMTGKRFGRLTVLSRAEKGVNGRAYWLCQCECGKQSNVCGKYLRRGDTKSCGCDSGRSAAKHRIIDLTGKRFGRLVVLRQAGYNNLREIQWLCQCDCGSIKEVVGARLRREVTTSCGCLHREMVSNLRAKHRKSNTRTFRIWMQMQSRCHNPNDSGWKAYGGRGIRVCDRWLQSFENFLEDMGECPEGFSIERVNVNGNYEPSNCKWIPLSKQAHNTRKTRYLTYQDETFSLLQWAEKMGLKAQLIRARLHAQWSVEEALTTPKGMRRKDAKRRIISHPEST